jgi:deoxycytidylate deaminase
MRLAYVTAERGSCRRKRVGALIVPCRLCALRIIQAGIKTVVYHEWYQSQGTLEVEALFAARDPSSIEQDSRMPNEKYRRQMRVELQRLDLPMGLVKPTWVEQSA